MCRRSGGHGCRPWRDAAPPVTKSADPWWPPGPDAPQLAVGSAELFRVRLPLIQEHRAAHGSESVREAVLVRVLLDDGSEGWGECSALSRPTYTAEHVEGAWLVLARELLPALLDGRPAGVVRHPMAATAVEVAVADAQLRSAGVPLADALGRGSGVAAALPTAAVVGLGATTEELLAMVERHLDDGAELVKLKMTPAVAHLAAATAVRSCWPDVALAVDFNQTADADALRALDRTDLVYVEQPAPADDLVASARLATATGVPVALDESVVGLGSFAAAVALGAGSVLNLKPARVGGLGVTMALLDAAAEAGWDVFVGGMLETGVGRAAAAAVAAQPGFAFPTDLGPSSRYFAPDITEPLVVDHDGHLVVPTGPGIGRSPDPARLRAVTVDRLALQR